MAKFNQWRCYGERKGDSVIITNVGYTIRPGAVNYLRICKCGIIKLEASSNIATSSGKCNNYRHKRSKILLQ